MLISAADFRLYYPLLEGTGEDTAINRFILAAGALIARWCRFPKNAAGTRSLASSTYTLYFSSPSRLAGVLCLCVAPVISITSVRVDADRAYGASTALVEGTDFDVDLERGALALLPGSATTRWPTAYRAIKVVAVAGYATTPDDLTAIVAATVRHLWDRRNVQGQESYTLGGDSATLADADALLPAAVKEALATYRVCA